MSIKELKQKIKDQEIIITGLKYKIQCLEQKLENYASYQREQCCECDKRAVQELSDKEFELFKLKENIADLIK